MDVNVTWKSGDALRNWRSVRNLTQAELADHLGIARETLVRWEKRKVLPAIVLKRITRWMSSEEGFKIVKRSDNSTPVPAVSLPDEADLLDIAMSKLT